MSPGEIEKAGIVELKNELIHLIEIGSINPIDVKILPTEHGAKCIGVGAFQILGRGGGVIPYFLCFINILPYCRISLLLFDLYVLILYSLLFTRSGRWVI